MCELEHIKDNTSLTIDKVNELIESFKNSFGGNIDASNVIDAVTELMKIVGKIKKLPGKDKKFIVTRILIHIVHETNQGPLDDLMDNILINIIPILIDKLVSVEQGKLVFNRQVRDHCCLPILGVKVRN